MSALLALLIICCPNGMGVPGPGKRAADAPPPPAPVTCLATDGEHPRAISGRADGRVVLHDLAQATEVELGKLPGVVVGVVCGADGAVLALDDQGHLVLFPQGGEPRELGRHEPGALALAVSPDGETAATAGSDGWIRTWSVREGRELERWEAHEGPVAALAWGPERLWSAGWDRALRAWKVSSSGKGHAKGRWPAGPRELTALAVGPQGRRVLTACWDGSVQVWAVKGRKATPTALHERAYAEFVRTLALDAAGARGVAVAPAEKLLLLFDPAQPAAPLRTLTQVPEPSAAVFVPGEDALLVGTFDGHVERVNLTPGGAQ